MFLTKEERRYKMRRKVASQSPQIGSMFLTPESKLKKLEELASRNPLKSGQCFLQVAIPMLFMRAKQKKSQSPQIGSMFLTEL